MRLNDTPPKINGCNAPGRMRNFASTGNCHSDGLCETDAVAKRMYSPTDQVDRGVLDCVGQIAERRGVSRAEVALAWAYGSARASTLRFPAAIREPYTSIGTFPAGAWDT